MLVLSRKKSESIIISKEIEITILGVEGDTVKIGINAPKDISILRKEIYVSIRDANLESVQLEQVDVMQLKGLLKPTENGEN